MLLHPSLGWEGESHGAFVALLVVSGVLDVCDVCRAVYGGVGEVVVEIPDERLVSRALFSCRRDLRDL